MKGKLIVLVAGAAGYVLGARAGRQRYEQIVDAAGRVWGNPKVQKRVDAAEDRAADLARQASSKVQEQVSSAAGSVKDTVSDKVGEFRARNDEPLGEQHSTRQPND